MLFDIFNTTNRARKKIAASKPQIQIGRFTFSLAGGSQNLAPHRSSAPQKLGGTWLGHCSVLSKTVALAGRMDLKREAKRSGSRAAVELIYCGSNEKTETKSVSVLVSGMKSMIKNIPWYILFVICLPMIGLVLGVRWLRKRSADRRIHLETEQDAERVYLDQLIEKIRIAPKEKYNQDDPPVWPKETGPVQYLPPFEDGWLK